MPRLVVLWLTRVFADLAGERRAICLDAPSRKIFGTVVADNEFYFAVVLIDDRIDHAADILGIVV